MKIFDNIYGFIHPQGANCNVYVFKDGADLDFVDSGIRHLNVNRWLWKEMHKDGLNPRNIRRIFHGHLHFDHIQADRFFQARAKKHKGNVEIYYPKSDFHRFQKDFEIIKSNFDELRKYMPNYPIQKVRGTYLIMKMMGLDFANYQIPENIIAYKHNARFHFGKRKVQVKTTGGHTQGHSFFFIDDEDKIMLNGDAGCINEYTSDWEKVLRAVDMGVKWKPHNRLGGHDPLKLGEEKAQKDTLNPYNRFDGMLRYILPQFRLGNTIDLSYSAHNRVKIGYAIPLVRLWAYMSIFCQAKFFQKSGLGKLNVASDGRLLFDVTNDMQYADTIEMLRNYDRQEDSPSRVISRELLGLKVEKKM